MNLNHCVAQGMTSLERESLKQFTADCERNGDIQSLSRTLIMIAHWMRQGVRVSFTEYASQWTEAQKARTDGNHSTPAMHAQWPFNGKRCITPAHSDYHPHGCDRMRCDDETEIRHAVTLIMVEHPAFNADGLVLYNRESVWQHPLEHPSFMEAAMSCMAWIREKGLSHSQIKSFPADNQTSYGLKHQVERFNSQFDDQTGKPGKDRPNYIPNGALIAAMVASGYSIQPTGKMNVLFNISKKALTHAVGEKT